ncbi:MAG: oligosaccharide flippase family protein [Ignavibacteriaceae bacterium]
MKFQKKLAFNFLSIITGELLSLVLNIFIIALSARIIGVINFGIFSFMISILAISSNVINMGFGPIIFRELSKNLTDNSLIFSALILRLGMFLVVMLLINVSNLYMDIFEGNISLYNILMLNIIFSAKVINVRELLIIPFKVEHRMHIPMLIKFFDNLLLITAILTLLISDPTLENFVIIYTVTNIPGFIILLFFLFGNFKIRVDLKTQKIFWLIKESLPIWGFLILMGFFQQIDLIMIEKIGDSTATGLYSAAFRLVMPLYVIPLSLVTTVFPLIVRSKNENLIEPEKLFSFISTLLIFFSLAFTAIVLFKKEEIITLIYGNQFIDASFALAILSISQLPVFLAFFLSDSFTANNLQRINLYYALISLICVFLINLFLIPSYSFKGAAVARFLSLMIGLTFYMIIGSIRGYKFLYIKKLHFIWLFVIALTLYILSTILSLIPYCLFGVLAIIVITIILRFFNKTELLLLFKLFNKEKWAQKIILIFKYQ